MNESFDVIIIGAGMSGLAAGIRLAMFDKRVLILEKHWAIGGLNGFYRLNGIDYDVGLHAITNFAVKNSNLGVSGSVLNQTVKSKSNNHLPLNRLLRQLRLKHEDFDLNEQICSVIKFPDIELKFNNDFEFFRSQIAENFPNQMDGFDRLTRDMQSYDEFDLNHTFCSTLKKLDEYLSDENLKNMILLPLMYYGNPMENDMDWTQFVIMFKSIYEQGFARPFAGVRHILSLLRTKFESLGGKLRLRAGVKTFLLNENEISGVTLENGETIFAKKILSSVGRVETDRLISNSETRNKKFKVSEFAENFDETNMSKLSFVESIAVFDKQPIDLGISETIVFFNNFNELNYKTPNDLVDLTSGVICCPNNYKYEGKFLNHGILRVTSLANPILWKSLSENDYKEQKQIYWEKLLSNALKFWPTANFSTVKETIKSKDFFTPKTIERFTGHLNGTVYGSPNKLRFGNTNFKNLAICGTDQGFLGIIGAILSGISMANLHVLQK